MQLFTILAALSVAFGTAIAADVCRPTGTDCFGSAVCCLDIQENNCCNLGVASTRIRFKLPNNSRAQGFSAAGCTGNVGVSQNPSARTVCFTYGSNRQSGRWLTGLASRVKRDPASEACAEPNAVLRVRDGVTTRIDLRDGMTIEDALEARDGAVQAVKYEGEYVSVD